MVDRDLIMAKASSVRRHCRRIIERADVNFEVFETDLNRQESILFNLQMAIQNCIDIAAHIVSEEGYGVPGSSNDMFYMLEENHLIDQPLTEKMVKAVGLRNLIVHEYAKIDLSQIFKIAKTEISDLEEYIKRLIVNTEDLALKS